MGHPEHEHCSPGALSWSKNFGLKNSLKNGLRYHFDFVTCLNYPFLDFSQCRKSKAISKAVFQDVFQAKIFASRSGPRSLGSPILLKIVSENPFSGKTYFYTISPSTLEHKPDGQCGDIYYKKWYEDKQHCEVAWWFFGQNHWTLRFFEISNMATYRQKKSQKNEQNVLLRRRCVTIGNKKINVE